jgi:hypothetical protein
MANINDVWVELNGGLGNQLFQYAFAYEIAMNYKSNLYVDCTNMNYTQSRLGIRYYNLSGKFVNKNRRLMKFSSKVIGAKIPISRPKKEIQILKLNNEVSSGFQNIYVPNYYFQGYFQSRDVAKQFLNRNVELKLKNYSKIYDNLKKEIVLNDVIIMHVRRGDYRLNKNWGLLGCQYYVDAINLLRKRNSENIWIFSDEINEVTKEFCSNNNFMLQTSDDNIKWVDESLSSAETLQLMSHSNRIIISNSTFSLWAAYQNINAKVVAPKDFHPGEKNDSKLLLSNWDKLNSHFLF